MTFIRSITERLVAGMFAIAVLATLSPAVSAQYLISTKAGFVNKVDGRVLIQRQESAEGERGRASLGTQMRDGDLLVTQLRGRAEILLTPGSYLRLYQDTEVRAVNTALDAPRFAVVKGSVIVEAAQLTKGSTIQIDTPNGPVSIGKEGIQRIDVAANGTSVSVRQGEVVLGTADQVLAKSGTKVGRGKMVQLAGTNALTSGEQPMIAKLNKDGDTDDFDVWSYNRAQTLMQANSAALRRSSVQDSMSLGWFYDPFYNCYTFMPGRRLFFSPYGFPFFSRYSDYYYYFPYGYGSYGYYPRYGGGQPTGGGGGGGVSTPGRMIAGHERTPVARSMTEREVSTQSSSTFDGGRGISTGVSSPSSSSGATVSAPSSAVSISAPASRGSSDSGGSAPAARPSRP